MEWNTTGAGWFGIFSLMPNKRISRLAVLRRQQRSARAIFQCLQKMTAEVFLTWGFQAKEGRKGLSEPTDKLYWA